MAKVPFYRHDLGEEEIEAVRRVLEGPILTTGETVAEFERRFAEWLGVANVVGLSSCTGAIHLSLLALGVGPGDEVVTTPMTFIASATAILQAGAVPVFVDVEPGTGLLDADRVEAAIGERTAAILPVHLYGQMCDMRTLRAVADEHRLHLIEDAAHCVEGRRDGVGPGGLGETACFSFYATKNLTSGEGGAVATDDDDLAARLRLLRLHGMTRMAAEREREGYSHWDIAELGWKYNMDNIQAALLLPQLDRLEAKHARREALAGLYRELLDDLPGLRLLEEVPAARHAHHLFPVLVDGGARDAVVEELGRRGIAAMVNYRAIHLLSHLRERLGHGPGSFPVAEAFGDAVLSLPFYPTMTEGQVRIVAEALREIVADVTAGETGRITPR